jgi:hypothetical protein
VDGDAGDWSGIPRSLLETRARPQGAAVVNITEGGFEPAQLEVPEGSAVIWSNLDTRTNGTGKEHQIALGEDSPVTWTSSALEYGQSDFFLAEEPGNYTYHTSRVDFVSYPEGNFTASEVNESALSYGVAFANTRDTLFLSMYVENISISPSEGGMYLKGVDILMDDFADGALEGENALRIERSPSGFRAVDMYYTAGYLVSDEDAGESSDAQFAYIHEEPDSDNGSSDYAGDLFLEAAVPIDTNDLRDLGAAPGMEVGVEIILRLSDPEQDALSPLPGVSGHYLGGGYPVTYTRAWEVGRMSVEPSEFAVVELRGGDLLERVQKALEEAWVWFVTALASAASALATLAVVRSKLRRRCGPESEDCEGVGL